MASNTLNRELVVSALATILDTVLVPTTVKAVYGYWVGDPAGELPFITVAAEGSKRQAKARGTVKNANQFILALTVYTPAADSNTSWTEAQAENRLDDIEKAVADVISVNHNGVYWDYLTFADAPTLIVPEFVGNQRVWVETMTLLANYKDR